MKNYILFLVLAALLVSCNQSGNKMKPVKVFIQGDTQGTYYTMTYYDSLGRNFKKEADSVLSGYDLSVSLYEPASIITKVNNNDTDYQLDDYFIRNFKLAYQISELTHGYFDFTIGPLVSAWGFGLEPRSEITRQLIDSLKQIVNYKLVSLDDNLRIVKADPRFRIDFNAIAQGFAVDILASFLESKGILNYLIDIGGEVYARGSKEDGQPWRVGIQVPTEDKFGAIESEVVVNLKNKAIATSGTYRAYYEEDSIRYSHTIDPRTGYPVKHNLLSVSVITDNCGTADALATAFMAAGMDSALALIKQISDVEAYFIYFENKQIMTYATEGMKKMLAE